MTVRRIALAAVTLALLIYAATGIYEVKPEESGVAFVFGRVVNSNVPSGIHWNFPPPIGRQVTMATDGRREVPVYAGRTVRIDNATKHERNARLLRLDLVDACRRVDEQRESHRCHDDPAHGQGSSEINKSRRLESAGTMTVVFSSMIFSYVSNLRRNS